MMAEAWMTVEVDHAFWNSGFRVAVPVLWTAAENEVFEQGLSKFDRQPDWAEKIAACLPCRTVSEVVSHFLLLDLHPVLQHHRCQTLVAEEESTPNSLGYLCSSGQSQALVAEESTQGQRNQSQTQGRRLKTRSKVWKHFTRDMGDSGKEIAKCKRCGKEYAYHGTKNLLEHLQQCDGQEPADVGAEQSLQPQPLLPPAWAPSGSSGASKGCEPNLGEVEAIRDLGRMIAVSGCEPSVMEDLNPAFMLPTPEAIGEMCHDIHMVGRQSSFALGKATFIEGGKVLYYLTDNFIDHEWNLCKVVEDAYVILPLGDVHYHLPFWGVPVVSPHDAVQRVASKIIPYLHGSCMVVGEITGDIHHIEVKNRLEQESRYVSLSPYRELTCTTYMDHVLHSIARCLLPDSDFSKHVFSKIKSLGWTEARDQKIFLSQLGLNEPWEYDERWYWCYCSLEILGQQILIQEDSDSEKLLRNLWREIYRAIRRVSVSSAPTSNLCLEELFKVKDALQCQLSLTSIVHADTYWGFGDKNVAGVLREALETVDKAIEASYLVWSIPLILDPRYKLSYIKERFEEVLFDDSKAANYSSNVTRKIKELYASCIKGDGCTHPLDIMDEGIAVGYRGAEAMVELDCYLEDSPTLQTEGFDVLNWWKVHGSVKYPRVAQMARYALAMPTCSNVASDQIAHVRSLHISESDCPGAKRKKV